MLWIGKRRNGRFSLQGVIAYDQAWPIGRTVGAVLLIALSVVVLQVVSSPIDRLWTRAAFSWLPGWYIFSDASQYARYSHTALMITFGARLLIDGFLIPVVEELYFRGYLLPRLSWLGSGAPWLNCALFSLYHFWQPYNLPTLFFVSFPIVFAVWKTRNVRLGIWSHAVLNALGAAAALIAVMRH